MSYFLKFAILISIIFQNDASMRTFTSDRIILLQNSRFSPLVTENNGTLVYASFPGYLNTKVRLESDEIGKEPCEIPLSSPIDAEYPLNFESLGNKKLILSLMYKNQKLANDNPEYRFIVTQIIDMTTCESKSVSTNIRNAKGTLQNWDYIESIIVAAGWDEFDIFMKSHEKCGENKACKFRYNDNAELVGITGFNRSDNATNWSIKTVADGNFSKGFFLTDFYNDMANVKLLDTELKVQKEKYLMTNSFLFSDHHGNLNQCHGISEHDLECELYNGKLESHSKLQINTLPYKKYVRNVKLLNLPDGSTLIFFILQVYTEPREDFFSTYILHLDSRIYEDNVSPLLKFQDNICKDASNIKIFKINYNYHCVSFSCRDSVRSKCIIFNGF